MLSHVVAFHILKVSILLLKESLRSGFPSGELFSERKKRHRGDLLELAERPEEELEQLLAVSQFLRKVQQLLCGLAVSAAVVSHWLNYCKLRENPGDPPNPGDPLV